MSSGPRVSPSEAEDVSLRWEVTTSHEHSPNVPSSSPVEVSPLRWPIVWARCGRSHPLLLIMVGLSSWRPSLEMKQNNVVFEGKNNCLGSYDRSTEACGTWLWIVKHQLIRCLTMRSQAPVELVLRVSRQEPIQKMLDRYDSSTIASSAWLWMVNHLLVRCLTVRSQEPFWWWSQELLF